MNIYKAACSRGLQKNYIQVLYMLTRLATNSVKRHSEERSLI